MKKNKLPYKLSLVVDMDGCPNRCKHCWLSHMSNHKMNDGDDQFIIDYFKPYFESIAYYSWLREPDYCDTYRERWIKDNELSIHAKPQRFELASFYKLVRDETYIDFLKEVGTKKVQLTFFGLETMSNKYIGRKNAFSELLEATERLISHQIAPRWQAFINEENKDEVVQLLDLIQSLDLYKRCEDFGSEFKFFVHAGSCDGENRKLYPIRINKENVPKELIPYFLDYDKHYTEQELCAMLMESEEYIHYDYGEHLVLNISNQMDVYFNYTHMLGKWKIGNLKEQSCEELIDRIVNGKVEAIEMSNTITIGQLIERYGDYQSHKLFKKEDYIQYLFNKYVEESE